MADDQGQEQGLLGEEEEVDYLFKVQMGLYRMMTNYWRHGLAVVGLILGVALIYGTYDSWARNKAEKAAAAVAEVDFRMPQPDQLALMGAAPLDDPADTQRMANLEEGANRYEDAAKGAVGATSADAWLKAGNTWERVGKPDAAMAAYENALKASSKGMLGFSARNSIAALHLEAGETAKAAAIYREIADKDSGFLAQQALLSLATVHDAEGDAAALKGVVDEFKSRFPTGVLAPQFARFDSSPAQVVPAEAG